jgi:adenosine deaminase CECR1
MNFLLSQLYDLDGKKYGPIECAQIYVDVLKDFKQSHPDFAGSKFIFAPLRGVDDATFDTYLPIQQKLMKNFPDFIAGFDLVGQEDKGRKLLMALHSNESILASTGRPLIDFAEKLLKYPSDIQFFFHAGETNWMGTSSDENLVTKALEMILPSVTHLPLCCSHQFDAILLGTRRIGHGYALVKYPHLLKVVKEKGIGIEINPISNQVLKLVDDIRNHPASILFTDDYPIVISR